MSSAIPNYPLKNEENEPILNRDRRFNHVWYSSKKLFIYDNESFDDLASPTPATDNNLDSVLSPFPANI